MGKALSGELIPVPVTGLVKHLSQFYKKGPIQKISRDKALNLPAAVLESYNKFNTFKHRRENYS